MILIDKTKYIHTIEAAVAPTYSLLYKRRMEQWNYLESSIRKE